MSFATLGLALSGCADSGPKSPIAPYTLQAIGTTPLPVVLYQEEGYRLEVTAGTIDLEEPDKYTMTMTVLETVDGNKSTYVESETGTWILGENGTVSITLLAGGTLSAVWSRTRLTLTREEGSFVYEMSDR